MTSSNSALIMLAAGSGIPVLAALNAALWQRLALPVAVVLFIVALMVTGVMFLTHITGRS